MPDRHILPLRAAAWLIVFTSASLALAAEEAPPAAGDEVDSVTPAVAGAAVGGVIGVAGCVGATALLVNAPSIRGSEASVYLVPLPLLCIPASASLGTFSATAMTGHPDVYATLAAGAGTFGGLLAGGAVARVLSLVVAPNDDDGTFLIVAAGALVAMPVGAAVGAALAAVDAPP